MTDTMIITETSDRKQRCKLAELRLKIQNVQVVYHQENVEKMLRVIPVDERRRLTMCVTS
jgi:hypothetical protein